ncbi:MAG: 1-acyl-sn-glycerol-3-phosphate acyltransferase [Chloroflexi bacterium]|nr:1-acyl-sn-glycerol-3-phosphate acyltransferase [Chloroflexota bacterium]
MTETEYSIKYPRFVFKRKLLIVALKVILKVLSRTKILGIENVPKAGPVILAGNHVGPVEAALVAGASPRLTEFFAAGDLPLDPQTKFASDSYGFIPVNRGNLDRLSLRRALDVLAQDGVLAIFPEGGTWEPTRMPAQLGVALLSQRANAPVVPVGLSGVYQSMGKAFKLKRPKMTVRFGQPIPPFVSEASGQELKEALQAHADYVLKQIYALIDPADIERFPASVNYDFAYWPTGSDEQADGLPIEGGKDLSRMLLSDIVLESFRLNLRMPVDALYGSNKPVARSAFLKALDSILELLARNPGFLSYRFGHEVADRQVAAIHSLHRLLTDDGVVKVRLTSDALFRDGHHEAGGRDYRFV